ncbi:bacteriochlorophyll 4-vinyl reductase [uncultured Thiodictyon sp.]|uniref:bacteriochlorophyll 4-vinyl reductase n=1 Tax=uncultured Thiodictyon sp. TaxID=1846217 RepID=UPI0025F9BAEC|nr:bacteriochlorophyll 4-vinyl reductase [uncultured Thiodictyon sp.]
MDTNTQHTPGEPARIGPNAILRVAEALRAGPDAGAIQDVFERAGLAGYLTTTPTQMVDEREVTALHQALRAVIGVRQARQIGVVAGQLTGDYLLANRIPRPAQWVLKALPRQYALRILLKAIERNAWTFAGSAGFSTQEGPRTRFILEGSRVCLGATDSPTPLCDFYAATFERLLRKLVDTEVRVIEVQCQSMGHPTCVFEVRSDA